ncbi:MAG: hypothetical protein AAGC93_26740 [Cyanobacteria bacterium P01_F01_bin.53]
MHDQSNPTDISVVLSEFQTAISAKVSDPDAVAEVLERIEDWAGEDVVLTALIANYVLECASQVSADDAELLVNQIVRDEILTDWSSNSAADYLNGISQQILDYERRDSLLIAYIKIFQRGKVRVDNSPEQSLLLKSGLVKLRRKKLSVSNMLLEHIFDLDWVEEQVPGITRPVSIVSERMGAARSLAALKFSPKVAAALCCFAVLGAGISWYVRGYSGWALATQNAADELVDEGDVLPPDMVAFNTGLDHGENGRWVPMFREFCELSKESVYFDSAKNRLAQWQELFPEGIEAAIDTVTYEKLRATGDSTCLLMDKT